MIMMDNCDFIIVHRGVNHNKPNLLDGRWRWWSRGRHTTADRTENAFWRGERETLPWGVWIRSHFPFSGVRLERLQRWWHFAATRVFSLGSVEERAMALCAIRRWSWVVPYNHSTNLVIDQMPGCVAEFFVFISKYDHARNYHFYEGN